MVTLLNPVREMFVGSLSSQLKYSLLGEAGSAGTQLWTAFTHHFYPPFPHVSLLLMSLSPEDVASAPPEARDLRSAGRSAETGSVPEDGTLSRAPAAVLNVLVLL